MARVVELADASDDDFYAEPATRLGVELAADLAEDARARHDEADLADAIAAARRSSTGPTPSPRATRRPVSRPEPAASSRPSRPNAGGSKACTTSRRGVRPRQTWHEIGEPYGEAQARARLAEALLATGATRAEVATELRAAAALADALRATPLRDRIGRVARWARVDGRAERRRRRRGGRRRRTRVRAHATRA